MFSAYLAEFGRIMGDLGCNEEAQREQLYEGLSDEIKDALVTSCPRSDSMGHLIQICRELDNRIRARTAERSAGPSNQRSPRSGTAGPTAPVPAPPNPTGTNSGHYGAAPMDLSTTQRTAERNHIKQEHIARGECIYCGTAGHFLRKCSERAATRARRSAMAATTVTTELSRHTAGVSSTEQSEN